jgi:type I restriction enzyme M protein
MTEQDQKQLGKTLWNIADQLRGAMNADDFRDYMLSFLFLRYLSENYEQAAMKELGADYPKNDAAATNGDAKPPLALVRTECCRRGRVREADAPQGAVIKPDYLWGSIVHLAKTQSDQLLNTLQKGFRYIEEESFHSSFQGLFSEINLASDKLGRKYEERNTKLCSIISELARGMSLFSTGTDTLGDAYEYLIGQFAAGSGKKAGEFYTRSRFQASSRPSSRSTARSRPPARARNWRACSILPAARVRSC